MQDPKRRDPIEHPDRRKALGAISGMGIALGLTGCLGNIGGGGTSDSIKIGGISALSGPYSSAGKDVKRSVQVAADLASENDVDKDIKVNFKDSEGDPSTAQNAAQQHIDDNVTYLTGSVSDAVCRAVGDVAKREGLLFVGQSGANAATGEKCQSNVFAGPDSVQQANGAPRKVLTGDNGNTLFTITANYSWGEKITEATKRIAENNNVKHIGGRKTDFGQKDYSDEILAAKNSGADIVMFAHFAGEHVRSAKQQAEFNLIDKATLAWPLTSVAEGKQIPAEIRSHKNFNAGTLWYWARQKDAPAAREFVKEYRKKYDLVPSGSGGWHYGPNRTVLKAIGEADSTDAQTLRKKIRGNKIHKDVWGQKSYFRSCDQCLIYPTMVLRGKSKNEMESENDVYEIIEVPNKEKQKRPCSKASCRMENGS